MAININLFQNTQTYYKYATEYVCIFGELKTFMSRNVVENTNSQTNQKCKCP